LCLLSIRVFKEGMEKSGVPMKIMFIGSYL